MDKGQPSFKRFRKAYAESKLPLVFFFGSGPSTVAGLPDWPRLKSQLVGDAQAKIATLDEPDRTKELRLLNVARKLPDYWVAFKILKGILGETSFTAAIRDLLTADPESPTPSPYEVIHQLNVKGVVSTNLDGLAATAFAHASTRHANAIDGVEIARKYNLILQDKPFVINLHGSLSDRTTWVLTKDDLDSLLSNQGHRLFLLNLFTQHTVCFFGISADDTAVSGRLIELNEAGIETPPHYWITSRRDLKTDRWAEAIGIRLIRYESAYGHDQAFREIIEELRDFRLLDEKIKEPVVGTAVRPNQRAIDIIPSDELAVKSPEFIRTYLALKAHEILSDNKDDLEYYAYNDFCEDYDRAVFNAYYHSTLTPHNDWFGIRLVDGSLGEGSFGTVFQGHAPPDGRAVAVKILHQELRSRPEMLGGFRRGVRAMHILRDARIDGIVEILDAYELPPTIIMEFVEGANLEQVINGGMLRNGERLIEIMLDLIRIVRRGHALPETVLHRDLKPSNIMLRGYDWDPHPTSYDVVVLDFDLCWHKGSKERDVVFEARRDLGYLAPEQINPNSPFSTRNARVDSFGVGMVMSFSFSGENPPANQVQTKDWDRDVYSMMSNRWKSFAWRSTPQRIARLILGLTAVEQNLRLDLGAAGFELESILSTNRGHLEDTPTGLIAEELMHDAVGGHRYEWNGDTNAAIVSLATGATVKCIGDDRDQTIVVKSMLRSEAATDRRNIWKFFKSDSIEQLKNRMQKAGWQSVEADSGQGQLKIDALAPVDEVRADFKRFSDGLQNLISDLRFER